MEEGREIGKNGGRDGGRREEGGKEDGFELLQKQELDVEG